MQFTLTEQSETHEQLLKTFYPYELNEKKKYSYYFTFSFIRRTIFFIILTLIFCLDLVADLVLDALLSLIFLLL